MRLSIFLIYFKARKNLEPGRTFARKYTFRRNHGFVISPHALWLITSSPNRVLPFFQRINPQVIQSCDGFLRRKKLREIYQSFWIIFTSDRNSTRSQVKWILITLSPQMQSESHWMHNYFFSYFRDCLWWKKHSKETSIWVLPDISEKNTRRISNCWFSIFICLLTFERERLLWLFFRTHESFHLWMKQKKQKGSREDKFNFNCFWFMFSTWLLISMAISWPPLTLNPKSQWNWDFFFSFKKTHNDVVEFLTQFDVDRWRRETAPK